MSELRVAGTQSIERAFDILHLVASGSPEGLRLKDITERTALAGPTVHRILAVLQSRGLIERTAGARYVIGGEMTLLGLSSNLRRFREIAAPTLRALSDAVGDAVFLSVRSAADTVCVDRKIGDFPIQVLSIEIGSRRPLGISANAVAMLSRMSPTEAEDIIARNADRLSKYKTPLPILLERIAEAQRLGYVLIPQAIVRGTSAIGLPICDMVGRPLAAVSTIAISSRQSKRRIPTLITQLRAAADEISAAVSRTR